MAVVVVVASSRTQRYRLTTNLWADGPADDDSCFGCMQPRFESSSAHSAAMVEHGEAPPCYGGFTSGSPRFKSGARRPAERSEAGFDGATLSACGETRRQVTALGSKPRATRLRSSTLRLTVAVVTGRRIRLLQPRVRTTPVFGSLLAILRVCGPTGRRLLPEQEMAVRFGPHPLPPYPSGQRDTVEIRVCIGLPRFESWWRHAGHSASTLAGLGSLA